MSRPLDVTGYGATNTDTLTLDAVDETRSAELRTGADGVALAVDVATTAEVGVEVAGAISRDELRKLREQIDGVLGE